MADVEFEELRPIFNKFSSHKKSNTDWYRLALDVGLDQPKHNTDEKNNTSSYDKTYQPSLKCEQISPIVSNKCCSPTDPSCPQMPISFPSSVPNSLNEQNHDMYNFSKKFNSTNDYSNNNLKHPKIRVVLNELGREFGNQSPICGSPAAKAIQSLTELSDSESLLSDDDQKLFIITDEGETNAQVFLQDGDESASENTAVNYRKNLRNLELKHNEIDEYEISEKAKDNMAGESKRNHKRTRRKLPEIPLNLNGFEATYFPSNPVASLAEEILKAEISGTPIEHSYEDGQQERSRGSPEIYKFYNPDADSGNSTQPSPDNSTKMSPLANMCESLTSLSDLDLLDATHRGLYKFIPRHFDEMEIEIGDPIYVQREAEDLWCEGINLRTRKAGIFPAAYVTDVDYSDFDPSVRQTKKERYILNYLGSIQTLCQRGNQVLCQAVRKIAKKNSATSKLSCVLEISDLGVRMVNKRHQDENGVPCLDYFFHLKHVSFCGFHPKNPQYFGFITKHPTIQRFACHVFESQDSTRPIAEAFGRAFQRLYKKYMETAYPIEDIYIDERLTELF